MLAKHQRQSVFVQKIANVGVLQKQYRTSRAWAWLSSFIAVAVFFATSDMYWRVPSLLLAIGCIFHASQAYQKWLAAESKVDRVGKVGLSEMSGAVSGTVSNSEVKVGTTTSSVTSVPSLSNPRQQQQQQPTSILKSSGKSTAISLNSSSSAMKSPSVETFNSLRRRNMRSADYMQSPDNHPENYDSPHALRIAKRIFDTPQHEPEFRDARDISQIRANSGPYFGPVGGNASINAFETKPYHTSPLVKDTVARKANSSEPRKVDALKAVGLTCMPDEWIDNLKGNLGRHLYAIMKCHDESIIIIKDFLKKQMDQGKIPPDALTKVSPMLDHQVNVKAVKLDSGAILTIEEILKFCGTPQPAAAPAQQTLGMGMLAFKVAPPPAPVPGVAPEIIQKYEAAWSFFKLCRHLQDIINQRSGNVSNDDFLNGIQSQTFGLDVVGRTGPQSTVQKASLMQRLRELDSPDRMLRIEWQHAHRGMRDFITGRQEYEMADQDIVVALFLHRCDEYQARLITATTGRSQSFSDMHYVTQLQDLRGILTQHRSEASLDTNYDSILSTNKGGSSAGQISSGSSSLESMTLLNILVRNYPTKVSSVGAVGDDVVSSTPVVHVATGTNNTPHYDVVRISPQQSSSSGNSSMVSALYGMLQSSVASNSMTSPGGYLAALPQYKEILVVEPSRNDVFEAILILLIVIVLTSPPEDIDYLHAGGSENESSQHPSSRHVSSLRGMGSGSSFDARVVRSLFDHVVDRSELDRLLNEHHMFQQQKNSQQLQGGLGSNPSSPVPYMGHGVSSSMVGSGRKLSFSQSTGSIQASNSPMQFQQQQQQQQQSPLFFTRHGGSSASPGSSLVSYGVSSSGMSSTPGGAGRGSGQGSAYKGFNSSFFSTGESVPSTSTSGLSGFNSGFGSGSKMTTVGFR